MILTVLGSIILASQPATAQSFLQVDLKCEEKSSPENQIAISLNSLASKIPRSEVIETAAGLITNRQLVPEHFPDLGQILKSIDRMIDPYWWE